MMKDLPAWLLRPAIHPLGASVVHPDDENPGAVFRLTEASALGNDGRAGHDRDAGEAGAGDALDGPRTDAREVDPMIQCLLFPFWEHAILRDADHCSKRACQLLEQAPGSKGLARTLAQARESSAMGVHR